jgi:hypothetical protein
MPEGAEGLTGKRSAAQAAFRFLGLAVLIHRCDAIVKPHIPTLNRYLTPASNGRNDRAGALQMKRTIQTSP